MTPSYWLIAIGKPRSLLLAHIDSKVAVRPFAGIDLQFKLAVNRVIVSDIATFVPKRDVKLQPAVGSVKLQRTVSTTKNATKRTISKGKFDFFSVEGAYPSQDPAPSGELRTLSTTYSPRNPFNPLSIPLFRHANPRLSVSDNTHLVLAAGRASAALTRYF